MPVSVALPSVSVCSGGHDKIPQTRWLKKQINFLTVLEPGESKIKVLVGSVSSEGSALSLLMRTLILADHAAHLSMTSFNPSAREDMLAERPE